MFACTDTLDILPVRCTLLSASGSRKNEGTQKGIGVIPAFRGRGFGKILHATGLEYLARVPIAIYVGSTDTRNTPMAAVFQRNSCVVSDDIQLFYKVAQYNV